jgi:hypothetical protein
MLYSLRAHLVFLAGYTIAILSLSLIFSFFSARHPNPHEFATPLQSFWFGMIVWGVVLLLSSGIVLTFLSLPLAAIRISASATFLIGAAAGIGVFSLAGLGVAKQIVRATGVPTRCEAAVPGAVIGLAIFTLVIAYRFTARSHSS